MLLRASATHPPPFLHGQVSQVPSASGWQESHNRRESQQCCNASLTNTFMGVSLQSQLQLQSVNGQQSNCLNECSQWSKQLKNTVKVQVPVWNRPRSQCYNLLQTGMDCNKMRVGKEETLSLIKSKEAFAQFQSESDIFSKITEAELSLVQPGSTQES